MLVYPFAANPIEQRADLGRIVDVLIRQRLCHDHAAGERDEHPNIPGPPVCINAPGPRLSLNWYGMNFHKEGTVDYLIVRISASPTVGFAIYGMFMHQRHVKALY